MDGFSDTGWSAEGPYPVRLAEGETYVMRLRCDDFPDLWGDFLMTAGEYDPESDQTRLQVEGLLDGHPAILEACGVKDGG